MKLYLEKKKGAWGVVYMLHRVDDIDPNGITANEELKVSPSFLDYVIKEYKKKGFDFLTLDELYEVMNLGIKPKHPFVVFTLDDGYEDNFTKAYPIFKKNEVPFCIYVTTNFPNKKAFLWWYALEDYLMERTEVTLGDGSFFSLKTLQEKDNAFRQIRSKILAFPQKGFNESFYNLLKGFDKPIEVYVEKLAISWEQILVLNKEPLCTLGAHTVNHYAFTQLTEDEIYFEIEEGTRILEQMVGRKILHFSYPHGLAYERERKLTDTYGFKTITSCLSEVVRSKDTTNFIPRVILVGNS